MERISRPSSELPPALGIVELASLSRAAVVLDAIVKRSPVRIHTAQRVSPGKFLIMLVGGVAEVEEGFQAGLNAADGLLVDSLILAQTHDHIRAALVGANQEVEIDSLGTFEAYTASATVLALDTALKATQTDLVGIHLCTGIGGKGYWALSGALHSIEEAIRVADESVPQEVRVSSEIIAAPHTEALTAFLAPWSD